MSSKKWFDTLGIPPTTDEAIIKRAYRKKALLYHPDRNPSKEAQAKFIEVSKAYEQLLIFIKNPNAGRAGSQQRARTQRPHSHSSPYQTQQTAFERRQREAEERMRRARQYYEERERREEETMKRTLHQMSTGKKWKTYKTTGLVSIILAVLFLADYYILPTKVVAAKMTHSNPKKNYGSIGDNEIMVDYLYRNIETSRLISRTGVSPVIYNDKIKIWTPHALVISRTYSNYYLEKTMIFKDTKRVVFLENWREFAFIPDYSIAVTFPFIPMVLLLPLLTSYFRKKNFIFFYFFYHFNYYVLPLFITIILLSNDRWLFWMNF